jgi:NAD+ synthase (glutamine-hydrolysing)
MFGQQAHVGVAALNQTVGDWSGNERRVREAVAAAKEAGVRLLLLPEMCVPGYTLGDRLLREGTVRRSWERTARLAELADGIAIAVGLPIRHEDVLFNAMAMLADRRVVGLVAKENLASGDVEYENRYFQDWPRGRRVEFRGPDGVEVPLGTQMFELPGLGTVAFEICEDAWKGIRPGSTYALAGADILLNPSASWFTIGKQRLRRRMVTQASFEDHCAYLYTSLMGCDATRLVFDGSQFIAFNGRMVAEGRRFVFDREWELTHAVLDLGEIRQIRMEQGSWRGQQGRFAAGSYGLKPETVRVPGDYSTATPAPPPPPYWIPPEPEHPDPSLQYLESASFGGRPIAERDLNHLELELALAIGLRDYHAKSGIEATCLALSGGRDSAMVAYLVHRMYRYSHPDWSDEQLAAAMRERFVCAYLATENSGGATREAARAVAEDVGATFLDGNIQVALDASEQTVERMTGRKLTWEDPALDVTLQNIQARQRGMLIWTIANIHNALLLVTSNKSEAAVGYTTMDGDSSGGLAPIADVPKSLIILWLDWASEFHGYRALGKIQAMKASAELRPPGREQSDEADLMPFHILDQLMYAFVQLGQDPLEMFRGLWTAVKADYGDDPKRFAADIRKFVRLLCFAQWKRDRTAISFRVTAFDLDPKTGFRFPAVQAPFREELEELDRWVGGLPRANLRDGS